MTYPKQLAVIDCGTNTFHLLVVSECQNDIGFEVLCRNRHYVLLAEGGIETIADESILRAQKAVDEFKELLKSYTHADLIIVGTEALRVASNGYIISNYIQHQLGKTPQIITGDREAELIYKGNKLIVEPNVAPYLLMDIGGGSTEFILVDDTGIVFSKSYPLGVTTVYNVFNDTDPISQKAIGAIEYHIENLLSDLSLTMQDGYQLTSLIGASGSFEVLASVLKGIIPTNKIIDIDICDFQHFVARILELSIEQRNKLDSIPKSRVRLIQVALVMIRKIVAMYSPQKIGISPFAIKEGYIAEWLHGIS